MKRGLSDAYQAYSQRRVQLAFEGFSDIDDTLGPLIHFVRIRVLSVAEGVPLLTGT